MAERVIFYFSLMDGRGFLLDAGPLDLWTDQIFAFMDDNQILYDMLWSFRPATDEERKEWLRKE